MLENAPSRESEKLNCAQGDRKEGKMPRQVRLPVQPVLSR
jgi:hypothetical protein